MKLPIIEVDLGNYGVQVVDFSDYTIITSDLVEELHKGSGNFAFISSVELNLKSQLKRKNVEFEDLKGTRSTEVTAELLADNKKATAKAVDAVLASDETLIRFKEEVMQIEDKIALFGSLLRAMSMRHSDIKKLVELRLSEGAMGRIEVKDTRVKKETTGKGRGRKRRDNDDS